MGEQLVGCMFCTVAFASIGLLAYSVYATIFWRKPWENYETELFLPVNVTYWEFQKSVWSQWKWKYKLKNRDVTGGKSLEITHRCPSLTFDADLWYDGEYMASTDGKVSSNKGKNILRTGGKDNFGYFRFDTWWDKVTSAFDLNMNVYDSQWNQIADVNGRPGAWWNGNEDYIEYSDGNGTTIARMVRNKGFSAWTWDIYVEENMTDVLDARIFALMAGKISFGEKPDDSDMCNEFISFTLTTAAVALGILFILCLCYCCKGK